MKKLLFLLILPFSIFSAFAQDEAAVSASNSLNLQISTLPEAKLGFTQRFKFPLLQGDSPLTSGNNLNLALTAELSPISLNGVVEAVLTPVAFFELSAGGRIGTGWNIELFGSEIHGIGINQAGTDGSGQIDGNAFDGLLWKAQLGGAIQFDLAAIFPGEWNHILVRSYHEINYKGYSRAGKYESWYFEADDGENINGANYKGNFLLGYQMPVFLNTAAFLAEIDLFLYDTPGRKDWGDDLLRWTFSGILNFSVTKQFGITLITQFRTRRNFAETNWEDLYYRSRILDKSNPQHLEFYRIAAALNYRL